jgi:hypothetical protein
MKIRVKAEEIIYLECFVDVPDELIKNVNDVPNMTNFNISKWLDQNYQNFNWSDYDSDRDWYDWEEVTEEETA